MNRKLLVPVLMLFLTQSSSLIRAQDKGGSSKADEVVQAAIEAMGGQAYLDVRTASSNGRYFMFNKGRKAFTRFWDWTVYKDPVMWRFQLNKGKRQSVQIFNLALKKGWSLEGLSTVEPMPEEAVKDFVRTVNKDMDYIFRNRLGQDGIQDFYYGPGDVSGPGNLEAVEFIDAANNSVVVFFNLDSHLPVKTESYFVDKSGVRRKEETEFYNWHEFKGVLAPLRYDTYIDGEMSTQRFLEELSFNDPIPDGYFLEPIVEEKDKKKSKKDD